jgi:ornithine cyclodeaminase/alanine dehydrogenase-like protein (mu-crystallin family)
MVLILTESDVDAMLDMRTVIECLESAYLEQSLGHVQLLDRQTLSEPDTGAIVRIMAASVTGLRALGLKALLGKPAMRQRNGTYFISLLFDHEDSRLLAVISAARLTQLRTGAASAVATKYLAKANPVSVGVIGAGVQGYGQLEGIASILKSPEAVVFDIDQTKIKATIEKARMKLGLKVKSALEDDLYRMDVLCTATTSPKPVLFGHRLNPGVHINAIGSNAPDRQEIDESVLLRSRVFVDRKLQALKESGDLLKAIQMGVFKPDDIVGELCDVVSGNIRGRVSDMDLTLFKSVGTALQDVAVARLAYDTAVERRVGLDVSLA